MMKLLRLLPLVVALTLFSINAWSQCNEPEPPGTGPQACNNAPLFCSEADFDGFCSSTENSGVGLCPAPFCGSCENYHFLSFIANSTTIELDIIPNNCDGTGMGAGIQAHMYQTNDCVNFTAVSNCESPGAQQTINIIANNLQVGQIYYLMIDGWAGDVCEYTIDVIQGVGDVPVPVIPGPIDGPLDVCPGAELEYTVPLAFSATDYNWTITPAFGTVTSGQGSNDVTIQWNPTPVPLVATICVEPSNACETGPPVCTQVTITPIPPTEFTVDLCVGDEVECGGNTYTSPGFYSVTYDSYLGCDSVVNCFVNPIIVPPTIIQETLCEPDCYTLGTNDYCATGGYNEIFTNIDGCDSSVTLILIVLEADAIIAPPPVIGCGANSTITLDGTQSTSIPQSSGAIITYQWSGGAGLIPPLDMNTVDVNLPGTYTLTVTQEVNGVVCTDMTSVTVTEDTATPDPPTINGPDVGCEGGTDTYSVTPAGTGPAPTSYTWTVTGGTFVDNGTSIDVTWTNNTAGQVCVTADNDCGPSAQVCIDVTLGAGAADPVIDGLVAVCEGDMTSYTINPVDPTATYTWTVSGGASFTDNGTSIDVDFTDAMDGQVCVTATNSCGTSNEVCLSFVVSDVPVTPVITGDAELCDGETGNYSIPADPTAVAINWTTPNGEPITGQGTNAISVDWTGSTGGQVCVQSSNGCGNTPQVCFNVIVNPNPTATLSGDNDFCTGSGDIIDLTIQLTGTAPWNVDYTDGTNNFTEAGIMTSPHIIQVTAAGNYSLISVQDANGCTGTVSGTADVIENPLPTANISNDGAICAGSGDCVPMNIDLTGTPNWTIVIARDADTLAPITGVMATPFIYNDACQAGTYTIVSVTDGNGCTNTGTGSGTVTVNTAPVVSNIDPDNCDPTNTTYFVTFEITGGDPGSYTVNGSNAGISAGPPFIFTSGNLANGSNYSFIVDDGNACGPVTVEGSFLCDCTTDVGTMDQTQQTACGTECITAIYDPTGEVFDGDDVLEYILHTGSGLTIVGEIARSDMPEFCFDAGLGMTYGTTYYISAVVANDMGGGMVDLSDPCRAVAQGTPVIFFEEPTADLSGDVTICVGENADLTVNYTGPGPYNISYTDGVDTFNLNGINANPYTLTVSPTATTTYTLVSMSNANCPGLVSGTGTVTVNEAPVVDNVSTDCNATSTAFTVTFEISGGDAGSYQVLPAGSGVITPGTPAVFTSNEIPSPATYSFQVFDANGCDTILVETQVPVQCLCNTAVGDMVGMAIDECGDGPVTVGYDATNEFLDGDDVFEYILHNGSGNTIGYPIIARSDMPTFSFDAGTMTYGTTYYISAIVGNDDGTGSVDDMTDPCLQVAIGVPVTFFEVPTGTLSGDTEICIGDMTSLPVVLTGDAPWTIIIQDDAGTNDTITGVNSTTFNYMVSPSTTTTYTLIEVNDENCPGIAAGTATVTVNEAPTTTTENITINATNTGYVVCFDIVGGEAPYTVTIGGVATVVNGTTFCSEELPCGSGYLFEVDDDNLCGPAIVEEAMVICNCTTTAGEMDDTLIEVCGTGPAIAIYDDALQFLDGDDVVDYILHNGDGNYTPLQTNTVPEFSFSGALTFGTTYFITARVGNDNGSGNVDPTDLCIDYSNDVPVVFYQVPSATMTGGGEICAGQCIDLGLEITGGVGPWTVSYANNLGDTTTVVVTDPISVLTVCPQASTFYSLLSVEDQNCPGTATGVASVTIQGIPFAINVTETIDATNTMITICFDIIGGDPASYVVTGGSGTIINGTSFCSDPISCDQSDYFFLVQDGFNCVTDTVQGPIDCPCVSNAGIMSGNPVSVCEFEDISATTTVAEVLDANDVLNYVLHTQNNDELGTILATNTTSPDFSYDPAVMDCNVTYYISAIVGDDDGTGTGTVLLTDECLSVAEGTPIVFNCLPEASITGDNTICLGDGSDITLDLSGEGPFNVTVQVNGTDTTLQSVADGSIWSVDPGMTTTYTLVSIEDITTGCVNTAAGTVTITVNSSPDAGMPGMPTNLCEGSPSIIQLSDMVLNQGVGGTWSDSPAGSAPPGSFNAAAGTFNTAGVGAGTYQFEYSITGAPPCPSSSVLVSVTVDPLPVADAGADQEVSCADEVATLGGPNTTTGPNIEYEWQDASGAVISNDPNFDVSLEGLYTLTVTNSATGCTSTDQVEVIESIEVPVPTVSISDISCFGDDDGFIVIDSIVGGVGPYICSFNGGDFTQQKQFLNLSAGEYTILVQDSKGCEFSLTINLTQPDELTVELVANFEGEDDIIELGDSLNIGVELNIPFDELDTLIWSPADLISCDSCPNNVVYPENTTTFSIYVEDENGCNDEDDLRVLVQKSRPVFIPNAFSPDGDNINDIFYIQAGQSVKEIRSFLVFTRWGETVYEYYRFQPNNPNVGGWDGTFRGQVMDPAVFVYFAEIEFIDGLVEIFKGDVVLLK